MRLPNLRLSSACLLSLLAITCSAALGQNSPADYSRFDEKVNPVLKKMTLAEKVGQMTQAELSGIKDKADIRELALGSVLSGGGADPEEGNSVEAWAGAYNACQEQALGSRLGVPILYGVDAVHGHSNVLGAVIFPHNIGLGCANDADLIWRVNRVTAEEVRATGIQWNFAPCVAAPRDDRWGRTYEGLAEAPDRITSMTPAAVLGLQTADLSGPTAVVACAKHFIGDGGTTAERRECPFRGRVALCLDQGDTRCDEATLRRLYLEPYRAAVNAGVATVMPSYSSWNGDKCTGSHKLLTEILKEELGFEGFVISDYDAIDQCHDDYKTSIKIAINAGVDMAMVPNKYRQFIENLTELVEEGAVPMERIDDAVRRVLRVKAAAGLLDEDASPLATADDRADFGSPEHRELAREAVRRSLVLLKNDGALPLGDDLGGVVLAGAAADDIGVQCGGWTIDWQGAPGDVTTGGCTILEGFKQLAGGAGVRYSADGEDLGDAECIVAVVGEQPYAEGMGDDEQLKLRDEDLALLERCGRHEAKLVVVILSGRPIILEPELLAGADAIVAAWLPGTEGAGVADVLLGRSKPTGTLSFTWPKSADQHPINVGDEAYEPLFPFGHGLGYDD